jgi:hypothetical protein
VAGRRSGRSTGRFSILGRSIYRRRRPKSRTPLKRRADVAAEDAARHPGAVIEVFATAEHRIGLKPVLRRVSAPRKQFAIMFGERFDA